MFIVGIAIEKLKKACTHFLNEGALCKKKKNVLWKNNKEGKIIVQTNVPRKLHDDK